ncbi:hypothetical protein [Patulibacter sp. SYSU D01012]|uniref:hypothetical protein n=1 Tax=Patulibacter sp. SYSU D01012 TaxID=2817381 RepID=UPI001B315C3D|nr:hypothetical protein [Patulibacter sp. SYSU D01012]
MTGRPWPLDGTARDPRHHRVLHLFSARWSYPADATAGRPHETPAPWATAEALRKVAASHQGWSFADGFAGLGHLERQYARVRDRMPQVVGESIPVEIPGASSPDDGPSHVFLVRLADGQLSVCLSQCLGSPLDELPAVLIATLDGGPQLAMRVAGQPGVTTFQEAVHHAVSTIPPLRDATHDDRSPRLLIGSELHTMLFVREGDEDALQADDGVLVRRLLGRVADDVTSLRDDAIVRPGEFNRFAGHVGAIRPGASLLAGHAEPVCRNALTSAALLVGAASLLREVRDEAYAILGDVNEDLAVPRHRWSATGSDPFQAQHARLAMIDITVAFQIETHLDIRRVVSDAYLVAFHDGLAGALDIPRSVQATHDTTARLESAIVAASTRLTTRNAFVISLLTASAFALAALVLQVIAT